MSFHVFKVLQDSTLQEANGQTYEEALAIYTAAINDPTVLICASYDENNSAWSYWYQVEPTAAKLVESLEPGQDAIGAITIPALVPAPVPVALVNDGHGNYIEVELKAMLEENDRGGLFAVYVNGEYALVYGEALIMAGNEALGDLEPQIMVFGEKVQRRIDSAVEVRIMAGETRGILPAELIGAPDALAWMLKDQELVITAVHADHLEGFNFEVWQAAIDADRAGHQPPAGFLGSAQSLDSSASSTSLDPALDANKKPSQDLAKVLDEKPNNAVKAPETPADASKPILTPKRGKGAGKRHTPRNPAGSAP